MQNFNMASCHDDEHVALALQNQAIALLLVQQNKHRSTWVNDLWKERESKGHYHNLVTDNSNNQFIYGRLKEHIPKI